DTALSQDLGPSSAATGLTRQPPQDRVYSSPGSSTAFRPPGWVPLMNHSTFVSRVHGPGAPPVHASILARTTPLGGLNVASGCFEVRSRTNACQSGAAAVNEVAGFFDFGFEWSLLPIHSPTAYAGAAPSFGGATKPYVARSRASFAVPVLAATARWSPWGPLRISRTFDQIGLCFGCVLPSRMSDTRKAACGLTACTALGLPAWYTTLPVASRISRIIRGGTRAPPFAIAP